MSVVRWLHQAVPSAQQRRLGNPIPHLDILEQVVVVNNVPKHCISPIKQVAASGGQLRLLI